MKKITREKIKLEHSNKTVKFVCHHLIAMHKWINN